MTFNELVAAAMDRLNLSSTTAQTRIGQRVNEAYKEVTSSIGLTVARRVKATATYDADVDITLPELTLTGIEKVLKIQVDVTNTNRTLSELAYDELIDIPTRTGLPFNYAIKTMGSQSVTVVLDGFPTHDPFTLTIEAYDLADTLSGVMQPAFSESFHDVIIEHVLMKELFKMEKFDFFKAARDTYTNRLSDLRMFIAKSAYLDVQQGKIPRYRGSLVRWTYINA